FAPCQPVGRPRSVCKPDIVPLGKPDRLPCAGKNRTIGRDRYRCVRWYVCRLSPVELARAGQLRLPGPLSLFSKLPPRRLVTVQQTSTLGQFLVGGCRMEC